MDDSTCTRHNNSHHARPTRPHQTTQGSTTKQHKSTIISEHKACTHHNTLDHKALRTNFLSSFRAKPRPARIRGRLLKPFMRMHDSLSIKQMGDFSSLFIYVNHSHINTKLLNHRATSYKHHHQVVTKPNQTHTTLSSSRLCYALSSACALKQGFGGYNHSRQDSVILKQS